MSSYIHRYFIDQTSFASAIDLRGSDAVSGGVGPDNAQYASSLKVTTAGTITVVLAGGGPVTIAVADGETIYGQFLKINSVASVTLLRVGY